MLPVGSLEVEELRFQATGRQHRRCIIPQAVKHSLVLLKMGEIVARNMLSWLELLINRFVASSLLSILFMHICWFMEKKFHNDTEKIRASCRPVIQQTVKAAISPRIKEFNFRAGLHVGFFMDIKCSSKLVVLSLSRRDVECPYQPQSYQWLILIHCRHKVVT